MYANEYGHAYPPDLATLARTEDLTTYVFIAPSQHCVAPENRDARGEWTKIVPGSLNCTYFYPYRPDFTDQMAANSVVLYEPQALNDGRGANVLYADGHTKWLDAKTATTVISQVEAGINPPK